MKSLEEIKKILKEKETYLKEEFGVSRIGVFGSYVRGEQTGLSDVDILVEFSRTPGFIKYMDLEYYLAGLLGMNVDLVMKTALKLELGKVVLGEVAYI